MCDEEAFPFTIELPFNNMEHDLVLLQCRALEHDFFEGISKLVPMFVVLMERKFLGVSANWVNKFKVHQFKLDRVYHCILSCLAYTHILKGD